MKNVQIPDRCMHPGCACERSSLDEYCSDHCRTAGEGGGAGGCMCGHMECTGGGIIL